jgi:hypothetical protein
MIATKLHIKHEMDKDVNCHLVGVLQQTNAGVTTQGRPIALVKQRIISCSASRTD